MDRDEAGLSCFEEVVSSLGVTLATLLSRTREKRLKRKPEEAMAKDQDIQILVPDCWIVAPSYWILLLLIMRCVCRVVIERREDSKKDNK